MTNLISIDMRWCPNPSSIPLARDVVGAHLPAHQPREVLQDRPVMTGIQAVSSAAFSVPWVAANQVPAAPGENQTLIRITEPREVAGEIFQGVGVNKSINAK